MADVEEAQQFSKILEKLKQQVDQQRKKNQKIGVGDYVLVRYQSQMPGKRICEKQFAGQVIDTMNDDYIVSFLKNTDVENIKKWGQYPKNMQYDQAKLLKR